MQLNKWHAAIPFQVLQRVIPSSLMTVMLFGDSKPQLPKESKYFTVSNEFLDAD